MERQVPHSLMLKNGILEAYWNASFEEFYGAEAKRQELEPRIDAWNRSHPGSEIKLNFDRGKQILSAIKQYSDNLSNAKKNGISLVLYGANGTGKTLLAVSVLKEAMLQGMSCQMTSLGGLIECYTDGWTNRERREEFNEKIKNVDFLLIDDVGKEYRSKSSDLIEVAFDNLIRYRTFRNKPFIITTNTDMSRLQTAYGQSLISLLAGRAYTIEVEGVDYRIAIQSKDIIRLLKGG